MGGGDGGACGQGLPMKTPCEGGGVGGGDG